MMYVEMQEKIRADDKKTMHVISFAIRLGLTATAQYFGATLIELRTATTDVNQVPEQMFLRLPGVSRVFKSGFGF